MPADVSTGAAALAPGLYLLAVPIGAARDITLRVLDILATAEVLAAEDTRSLRRLMEIHGLRLGNRPLLALHDHNWAEVAPRLLAALAEGKSLAYAPEAGTPLVSDPGFELARAAIAAGHAVHAAPGPSALLAALAVAGLPTDRFLFAGFAPAAEGERKTWLDELANVQATVVIYESPRRVSVLLGELVSSFGGSRPAAVCRELTKKFEEVQRGSLGELQARFEGREVRGEIALVIGRAPRETGADAETVEKALLTALQSMSLKDAAAFVAEATGRPRREVYGLALAIRGRQ